jgi:hypothetical protein
MKIKKILMEIIIDKHCKKLKLQNFHYLITNMALQMNNYKKMILLQKLRIILIIKILRTLLEQIVMKIEII